MSSGLLYIYVILLFLHLPNTLVHLQQLGPLKAEQSPGMPAMHKQFGMDQGKMSMSGGQLGPLRGSVGNSGVVSYRFELYNLDKVCI